MWKKYKTNILKILGAIFIVITIIFLTTTTVQYSNEVSTLEDELSNSTAYCMNLEEQLEDAAMRIINLEDDNMTLVCENNELTTIVDELKSEECEYRYLGKFEITFYCGEDYPHICGSGNGVTSTGATAKVGVTIAVDPSVLPYGSEVYIAGYGYRIAQDCGGMIKGNRIDVYVSTHAEAMALGRQYRDVWIIVKK